MKKFSWPLIASILILGLIILGYKSCNLYDELSVQKGKYEAYRAVAKADYAKAATVIVEQTKTIAAKDKEIAVHKQAVFTKNEQIASKNKSIAALEESYSKLSTDVLKIENLTAQVAEWKSQFSLAQGVIADQEKIITAWEGKFNAQVVISEQYKAALDRQIELNRLCDGLVGRLEGKLRRTSFLAKAGGVAAIVAGGYIGYTLVKK